MVRNFWINSYNFLGVNHRISRTGPCPSYCDLIKKELSLLFIRICDRIGPSDMRLMLNKYVPLGWRFILSATAQPIIVNWLYFWNIKPHHTLRVQTQYYNKYTLDSVLLIGLQG